MAFSDCNFDGGDGLGSVRDEEKANYETIQDLQGEEAADIV